MAVLYWAFVVGALGWIYVALAVYWPWLFDREVVRQAERDRSGFRVGRLIHWRLPAGPAFLIAALSCLPILAAVWLAGWPRLVTEMFLAGAAIAAWLGAPPGTRLVHAQSGFGRDQGRFEVRPARDMRRAVGVLLTLGVVPALAFGAILYVLVSQLIVDLVR
jgi:hypothetical protein